MIVTCRPLSSPPPAARPAARSAEPKPKAAAPTDSLAVSFDRAREVALLPVFDPAVGAVMVMAGLALGMGGAGPVGAAMQPALSGILGDRQAEIHYNLDQLGMTSQGTISGGSEARDRGNVAERLLPTGETTARLMGRVGDDQEDLVLTPSKAGIHLSGTVGSTPVDLEFGLLPTPGAVPSGADQYPWASVSGTIGDSRYNATATLSPSVQSGDLAAITVRGALDDQSIDKTYRLTGDADSHTITIDGQGTLAGARQDMRLVVDLSQAQAAGSVFVGMVSPGRS
jgi:hypothetical protein